VQVEGFQRMQRPLATVPEERLGAIVRKRYGGDRTRLTSGVVPMLDSPQQVLLVVAGGAGRHSMCVPSFGNTRSVTRVVAHHAEPFRAGAAGLIGPADVDRALEPLRDILRLDGYGLATLAGSRERVVIAVLALDAACAECLVPKAAMERQIRARLDGLGLPRDVSIELRYPQDAAAGA
jgi:hypothetical protein